MPKPSDAARNGRNLGGTMRKIISYESWNEPRGRPAPAAWHIDHQPGHAHICGSSHHAAESAAHVDLGTTPQQCAGSLNAGTDPKAKIVNSTTSVAHRHLAALTQNNVNRCTFQQIAQSRFAAQLREK